jgi:hypothetical protein
MEEALRFFRAFEMWIYLLLGLGALLSIRKFILAWQELRGAVFGFERESAQARLNQAASVLVLLLTMAVTEFILVSFIAPAIPGAIPLPTPTLDLLATPTITLPAAAGVTIVTPQEGNLSPTATATAGCIPGQIEIISPQNGQEISGNFEVIGTVKVPNLSFYKFGIKRPDETIWLTLRAGKEMVTNGKLGDWDTTLYTPGEYQLSLIVVDSEAHESTPCIVQVRVATAPETTPQP